LIEALIICILIVKAQFFIFAHNILLMTLHRLVLICLIGTFISWISYFGGRSLLEAGFYFFIVIRILIKQDITNELPLRVSGHLGWLLNVHLGKFHVKRSRILVGLLNLRIGLWTFMVCFWFIELFHAFYNYNQLLIISKSITYAPSNRTRV